MLRIIKTNQLFFAALLLFIIIGGIILASIEQGTAILFFSDHRFPFGDFFFFYFTKLGEIPMYLFFFLLFLFIRFRFAILVPLTGVAALVLSAVLKLYFAHDRPFRFFTKNGFIDQIDLVEGITLYSGTTSFPSGHTTSAFALFGLVAFLFSRKQFLGLGMFFFALLVGISRVYLVQHFLKDIYLGAILGVLTAMLIFWLQNRYPINEKSWLDQSLLYKKKQKKKA